uniref:Retrovirus-related Pol polyprotein from transposon TNT 1-94 n=1 Tax=Tanacetum cinerariifolium TaxID=118510 RepID=A0A6L2JH36_TANCI|nr:retrovirus-related Pol polyprotein from transposon TNT 1-94 [Tanacetum cinerariifolium]
MSTLSEFMILSGVDNHPPMLEKHMYDFWKSIMELYMQNREHERMILESVEHGLLIWPTIEENGLPADVYSLVNHHRVTKDLWERVQLLMQGGNNSGQQRVVKCFNYQEECHMARQYPKPKRKRDVTWFRDKVLLVEEQGSGKVLNEEESKFLADPGVEEGSVTQMVITHNTAYQADDLDTYDSDCDDFSTAKAVLMANLSSYGLDVLSEVPHSKNTHTDMLNQSVQEMSYSKQTHLVNYPEDEIISDNNIIPYSQYLLKTQNATVQDTNSSSQNDAMILFVFEQLSNQVTNCNKVNKDNLIANESLYVELERYKERLKLLEERQNVDLSTREKLILDDIIQEKNAQFADFEKEINYLKQTLADQSKENELLTKTFNIFKNESKEKEAKNIDKEITLEKKVKKLDNTVIANETNVISIADFEETLMLEEESQSKVLLKQSDPKVFEKKVNIKPINYAELNRLSEDFGKPFVPQQELSDEQAFRLQTSHPNTDSPVKIKAPRELPKVVQIVLWYLDSECSKHMTDDISHLTNFVHKLFDTVKFDNDQIEKIIGYGDYQIGNITILSVYYVEGLGHNLLSVGQLCDSDLEVAFRKHTCFVHNLEGDDLLSGSQETNLYTLSVEDMMASSPICLLSKASKTKSWLWHRRLSHLNFGAINHLVKNALVRDTNQEKLYLLHMDLCGPMHVASINGKKYILVNVDDYSRFTWVKFLASKYEALDFIIKFLKMIQVKLNTHVRNIRTDNETECVNQTLRSYYESVGISHKTLVARSPQQNGVVERRNRTLVKVARTMLIYAKAPLFLWAEAVATTCYTQNRSIIWRRHKKNPYELLHDRKPDLSYLHVFGFEESPKMPHFHDDPLHESLHEDSTSQGSSSNVRPIHTPFESLGRWTKDRLIANVIRDPYLEPKNFKQEMIEPSWIDAMQEEIHESERLQVWELVSCPNKAMLIKLKWKTSCSGIQARGGIMTSKAQQIKLDNALVALENHHVIGKCNMRINPGINPKESTYQVVLDALSLTTCYPAFLITVKVLVIYMHQFWATVNKHKASYRFKIDNKKFSVNVKVFKDILNICLRIPSQEFDEPPTKEEAQSFIRELGHSREIKYITDVIVDHLHQPWRTIASIINKCLRGKEDMAYQIDLDSKKQDKMFYPRFTKIIINHFLKKDKCISLRNKTFMHTARDDSLLGTMRFVSRHADTQVYGVIIPEAMTNQALLDSVAYKTYFAIAFGAKPLKSRKSQKKSNSAISSEESPSKKKSAKAKKVDATKPKPTKKKAPVKADRGKGVPNELHRKTLCKDEGTEEDDDDEDDTKDDEANNDSDANNDDDGNNGDDDDDANDDDNQEDDDTHNDDEEIDSDRTESDKIKIPVLSQSSTECYEEEEENIDDEETMDEEEEDNEVTKELYNDVNINLGNKDADMTDANQADNEIASLMDTTVHHEEPRSQTSSLYIVPVMANPEVTSVFTTTIPPPHSFFNPLPQQATPTSTPTASETITLFPTLLNFSFVFKFNDRDTNLEKDLEAIQKAILAHNLDCREEAQAEKRDYIELVDTSMKDILKEEVNTQLPQILPQAVSDFATLVIENVGNTRVPSCFTIFDLEPLLLSFDFVISSEIFKSLSFSLYRLFHLGILCLDHHAHTLHHLESLLTISFDRLDILKEDLVYQSLRKSLSLILKLS